MYNFIAKLSNSLGGSKEITNQESKWQIISIRGLNPPAGRINTLPLAGFDGARFNSEHVNTRNIVLMLAIKGDVEANRQELENIFIQKRRLTFLIENGTRKVTTTGYVETVEVNQFSFPQTMQVSIICPDPYFYDQEETEVTGRSVTVQNASNYKQGFIFKLVTTSTTSEVSVRASNGTTKLMTIVYPFVNGDVIEINTNNGQKSATLTRGSTKVNLFPYITDDSVFYQLDPPNIPGTPVNTQLHYYGESNSQAYISGQTSGASWTTRYLGV